MSNNIHAGEPTILERLFSRSRTEIKRDAQDDLDLCGGLLNPEKRYEIQRLILDPNTPIEKLKSCEKEMKDAKSAAKFCKLGN